MSDWQKKKKKKKKRMISPSDLPLGVEVGAALPPPIGQPGQSILEILLEAQELDDAGVDAEGWKRRPPL